MDELPADVAGSRSRDQNTQVDAYLVPTALPYGKVLRFALAVL